MSYGSILVAALLASSPVVAGADLPKRAELLAALNALETCGDPPVAGCSAPSRAYRVHKAKCMRIAPERGRAAVACRVDLSLDYPDPERNTRHRDSCLRFVRGDGAGNGRGWEVLNIHDRPCEMPSALVRDPNPEPGPEQMERALVGMFTCYDTDGITDCFSQPTSARIEKMVCKSIAPGAEGNVRVACRVTGSVVFSSGFRRQALDDICIRLERTTPADESPAYWVGDYVSEKVRCEVH